MATYVFVIIGISAALSQLGWWGAIFLLGEIGPILISSPLKSSGTLYFLSGMCLIAFLHVLFLIPETKVTKLTGSDSGCAFTDYTVQDQSLEKIEDLFNKPWSKRANVLHYLR